MLCVVAGYRGKKYIHDCLDSLNNVTGITETWLLDDSGDDNFRTTFNRCRIIPVSGHNAGFQAAIQTLKAITADREHFFLVEEDFRITTPTNLDIMAATLDADPNMMQLALLRQPWFTNELEAGGVIQAREQAGATFTRRNGLITHTDHWTNNPAVWSRRAIQEPWPTGRWSEAKFGRRLLRNGRYAAYLEGIRCEHVGERSGHNY